MNIADIGFEVLTEEHLDNLDLEATNQTDTPEDKLDNVDELDLGEFESDNIDSEESGKQLDDLDLGDDDEA